MIGGHASLDYGIVEDISSPVPPAPLAHLTRPTSGAYHSLRSALPAFVGSLAAVQLAHVDAQCVECPCRDGDLLGGDGGKSEL